jgi:F0F1-type ATP synthase assembly protein I
MTEPQKPQDKPKDNWLEKLAQKSTGLPDTAPKPDAPPATAKDATLWKYAGLGLQFAGTVAIFAYLGYELDRWKNWSPWGLVTLSMIAVIGNLYLLIKEGLKEK